MKTAPYYYTLWRSLKTISVFNELKLRSIVLQHRLATIFIILYLEQKVLQ